MVGVAQSVRVSGCGSEGRGFDSHHSPHLRLLLQKRLTKHILILSAERL